MSARLLRTTWRCTDTWVQWTEGAARAGDEGNGLETRNIGSCVFRLKYCACTATSSPFSFPAARLQGHNSECFSVPADDRGGLRSSRQCRRRCLCSWLWVTMVAFAFSELLLLSESLFTGEIVLYRKWFLFFFFLSFYYSGLSPEKDRSAR